MNCPKCNDSSIKLGFKSTKDGSKQRYKCNSCKYIFTDDSPAVHLNTQIYNSQEFYRLMVRASNMNMNLSEYIKWRVLNTN